MEKGVKAGASPTKAFFVKMITRDIALEDCILDLIDNSIDGAWRHEGSHPIGLSTRRDLSKYTISINADESVFSIIDNCGGMTLDDAVNHAFSFGRPPTQEADEFSIGVYGIGMKRAIFKIGSEIKVRSTYKMAKEKTEPFCVPIRTNEWIEDDSLPWDFDIILDEPLKEPGVEIVVKELLPDVAAAFDNPDFIQDLRRTIARDYSLYLNQGLRIVVNNKSVSAWTIELRQSDEFLPMRASYVDKLGTAEVSVEIIGGMAAPPPESTDPADTIDSERRYGWYVICNGRVVLAADRSEVSGWGTDDWPQWHYQYSGFIGVIIFTAKNAAILPLTTTKRSVDISSEIFRRARPKMREVAKAWIAYTNSRKQALDEAKQKESVARTVPIYEIAQRALVLLPNISSRPKESLANVHYSVPLNKMKKLAAKLGSINMPYREVGLKSFNYTFDDVVGSE